MIVTNSADLNSCWPVNISPFTEYYTDIISNTYLFMSLFINFLEFD